MILKWIQSVGQAAGQKAAEQGDEVERKQRKDAKLVDVAHEAMGETSPSDAAELDNLIKMGWPHVQRERVKSKVRSKVWDAVKNGVGAADDDMVEEITERIVDAAEADPFYKRLFGTDETA